MFQEKKYIKKLAACVAIAVGLGIGTKIYLVSEQDNISIPLSPHETVALNKGLYQEATAKNLSEKLNAVASPYLFEVFHFREECIVPSWSHLGDKLEIDLSNAEAASIDDGYWDAEIAESIADKFNDVLSCWPGYKVIAVNPDLLTPVP